MTQPNPINQRYVQSVILDGLGVGTVQITPRADFALQQTSWRVQGGTGTAQSTAQVELNGDFWQGTYSGNNDSSQITRLVTNNDVLQCDWTGGPPGATATLTVFGLEYPAGQGIPPPANGSGPSNPILGGETLIRNSIQSQNYVPGVSGWAIFADGSMDMNNGVFRGTILVNSADGSFVQIAPNNGGKVIFGPKTVAGVTVNASAEIFCSTAAYGAGHRSFMTFNTGRITDASGSVGQASFQWGTRSTDGTPYPGFPTANELFEISGDAQVHGNALFNGSTVMFAGNGVTAVDLKANGQSMGYGWIAGGGNPLTVGPIGATETQVCTLDAAYTFRAGRVYQVVMSSSGSMSAAGRVIDRLRKGVGIAGTQLGLTGHQFSNTGTGNMNWTSDFYCTTANDVNTNLSWTGNAGAAAPTASYVPNSAITMDVFDLGPSTATQRTYLQQLA